MDDLEKLEASLMSTPDPEGDVAGMPHVPDEKQVHEEKSVQVEEDSTLDVGDDILTDAIQPEPEEDVELEREHPIPNVQDEDALESFRKLRKAYAELRKRNGGKIVDSAGHDVTSLQKRIDEQEQIIRGIAYTQSDEYVKNHKVPMQRLANTIATMAAQYGLQAGQVTRLLQLGPVEYESWVNGNVKSQAFKEYLLKKRGDWDDMRIQSEIAIRESGERYKVDINEMRKKAAGDVEALRNGAFESAMDSVRSENHPLLVSKPDLKGSEEFVSALTKRIKDVVFNGDIKQQTAFMIKGVMADEYKRQLLATRSRLRELERGTKSVMSLRPGYKGKSTQKQPSTSANKVPRSPREIAGFVAAKR